jgi:hypothetical protein
MNGVISTQFELLGELARFPRKWSVDSHEKQLTLQRLELIADLRVSVALSRLARRAAASAARPSG